jgi:hypothetical protein
MMSCEDEMEIALIDRFTAWEPPVTSSMDYLPYLRKSDWWDREQKRQAQMTDLFSFAPVSLLHRSLQLVNDAEAQDVRCFESFWLSCMRYFYMTPKPVDMNKISLTKLISFLSETHKSITNMLWDISMEIDITEIDIVRLRAGRF